MKVDKILRTALEYGASDIYLTSGTKPTLRINGALTQINEHPDLTAQMAEEYIFEMMTDRQREEFLKEKELDFSIEISGVARFRANAFEQRKGKGIALRLIPSKIQTMDELGLSSALKKIPHSHNGLVLITGPTGSGKSTTLSSMVQEINTHYAKHIITVEDPIEFVYTNNLSIIEQREVGTHTQSFKRALRSALREDPDVILVGEMRDLETIELALTAAETGHLVLGTLHTSGAAKSIDRIIDVFPSSQQNQIRLQLADQLRAIVWQSLLVRRDGKGRVGAFEIMFNVPAVANLIRSKKSYQIQTAIETNMGVGMQTMKKSVLGLLEQGLITDEEAQAHIPEEIEMA